MRDTSIVFSLQFFFVSPLLSEICCAEEKNIVC
jgi:hypothetical protein